MNDVTNLHMIKAHFSLADQSMRILKHSDTFALFDRHGDIRPLGFEDHGIYHAGTRFLSRFVMNIEGKSPLLLSSSVKENNYLLVVDLTNPDFEQDSRFIKSGTVHIRRSIFLWHENFYENISFLNYSDNAFDFSVSFFYEADFSDIFEIRGEKRLQKGEFHPPYINENYINFNYRGLDEISRSTQICFSQKPAAIDHQYARFSFKLEPALETVFSIQVTCLIENKRVHNDKAELAFQLLTDQREKLQAGQCSITTSNEQFNDWINRSQADLYLLLTQTAHGYYPYAGIPWYSTIFGRDGIITAFETLWLNPEIARGVLKFLAAYQATTVSPEQDSEPGKIIHEMREGEMVNCAEIPFGRYYGTIDATPLFIALAGHYYERTADIDFIKSLWPHIELALKWIDDYGDKDRDGFVEYSRSSQNGLANQGWKDSEDSVFHQDSRLAPSPIALCEVQGYVYEAKKNAARLAADLGYKDLHLRLYQDAENLQIKFNDYFWSEEMQSYILALDGNKDRCEVKSSNAGHCLFSGIADGEHAQKIANQLTGHHFFSGWGVRTIADTEARYNPMSYHNGSIWPHDNALIAYGMNRYGLKDHVLKILTGIFDATLFIEQSRLPELFCGFPRSSGEGPVLYPVACNPQAWATGAVFLLLQACLGLSIQALENKVYFNYPILPEFLNEVKIRNLKIGDSLLDIRLERHTKEVGIDVIRRSGHVKIIANY